jgi:hypothetical protein
MNVSYIEVETLNGEKMVVKSRYSREDNIKTDMKVIRCEYIEDSSGSELDPERRYSVHNQENSASTKCTEFLDHKRDC